MRFIPLMLLLTCVSACFEPKKACMDIEAANFDAAADADCCCVYPRLLFDISQEMEGAPYKELQPYQNAYGWYRPHSILLYLSEFQLEQQGKWHPCSDTLSLKIFEAIDTGSQIFVNDFALLRRTTLALNAGTFRPTGLFTGLQFRLGLSADAHRIVPSQTPKNHPLQPQAEGLWLGQGSGFVVARVVVAADSLASTRPDTLVFTQQDFPNALHQPSNWQIFHEPGYDINLRLTLELEKLFEGVNWQAGLAERKTSIRDNLLHIFRVD